MSLKKNNRVMTIVVKFQGFGGLGGHGRPAVCPVAPGSRLEGESVTPRSLAMVDRRVWERRPTHGRVALSLVLLMETGHPGNPGLNAGLRTVRLHSSRHNDFIMSKKQKLIYS